MNRVVAVGETEGPEAALALLDTLPLEDYRYYHSTLADFFRRLGRNAEARAAYTRALELMQTDPERRLLEGRLLELRPRSREDWDESWTYTLEDLKQRAEGQANDAGRGW